MNTIKLLIASEGFWVNFLILAACTFVCFGCMVVLRVLRRGAARFWMAPSSVALALVPGVLSVGLTAHAFRRVLAGMSVAATGGVGAVAAGCAESLVPLLIGLIWSVGLSVLGLLLVVAGSERGGEPTTESGPKASLLVGTLLVLASLGLAAFLVILIVRIGSGLQGLGQTLRPAQIVLWWRAAVFAVPVLAVGLLAFIGMSAFHAPRGSASRATRRAAVLFLLFALAGTVAATALLWGRIAWLLTLARIG